MPYYVPPTIEERENASCLRSQVPYLSTCNACRSGLGNLEIIGVEN